jgi:hypothetical protein
MLSVQAVEGTCSRELGPNRELSQGQVPCGRISTKAKPSFHTELQKWGDPRITEWQKHQHITPTWKSHGYRTPLMHDGCYAVDLRCSPHPVVFLMNTEPRRIFSSSKI